MGQRDSSFVEILRALSKYTLTENVTDVYYKVRVNDNLRVTQRTRDLTRYANISVDTFMYRGDITHIRA